MNAFYKLFEAFQRHFNGLLRPSKASEGLRETLGGSYKPFKRIYRPVKKPCKGFLKAFYRPFKGSIKPFEGLQEFQSLLEGLEKPF